MTMVLNVQQVTFGWNFWNIGLIIGFPNVLFAKEIETGIDRIFCDEQNLKLDCPKGREIFIRNATYGRMEKGVCGTSDFRIGCRSNSDEVLGKLNGQCATRSSCSGQVERILNGVASECPSDAESYLKITSSCIKVAEGNQATCDKNGVTVLRETAGVISSSGLRKEKKYGYIACRYTILASLWQEIHLSVYFMGFTNAKDGNKCPARTWVRFIEKTSSTVKDICNTTLGSVIYQSESNQLDLDVGPQSEITDNVLLYLNYTVVGCAEYPVPWYMETQVLGVKGTENERLRVSCMATQQEWFLSCLEQKWVGIVENCTKIPEKRPGQECQGELPVPENSQLLILKKNRYVIKCPSTAQELNVTCVDGVFLGVKDMNCPKDTKKNTKQKNVNSAASAAMGGILCLVVSTCWTKLKHTLF